MSRKKKVASETQLTVRSSVATTLPPVERVSIDTLTLDPRNARKHEARDLAVTGASLDRFGQVEPLIVWQNVVIAGNGRLQHMRAKGTTHAEIRRMDHLSEAEARELAVRLNRSGTLAGWNEEILLETLREIESAGVDLSAALAYDRAELDALTNAALQSAETPTERGVSDTSPETREQWPSLPDASRRSFIFHYRVDDLPILLAFLDRDELPLNRTCEVLLGRIREIVEGRADREPQRENVP